MQLTVDSGQLPVGWQVKKLGEVCQIKPSKEELRNKLSDQDLVSFIPMSELGIKTKKIELTENKLFRDVAGSYTYFADNDVLLAKITPCFENGKLGIARNLTNGVGFGSSEYIVFRSKGSIDPEYLFYFLSQDSFINSGARVMTGAVGHRRVPKEFIENYLIPIPPLPEQKRIIAILDEAFEGIDRAISNTEKNLSNARELFDSYLNSIFSQKGEGWEEKKLEDVCEKVEYGSSAKSLAEGEIPVLRMGNIQNGAIDWSNLVYTNDQEEINKYLLKYNDVLFNRTNSDEHVGKTAIYKGEMPAIFAGYLIRIHRKEELIDADFLNFYLNSPTAREYGKSIMSRSVNQANINGTKLKGYPISIPSLSIQKQIVKNLSFLRTETQRLENIYRQKIAALKELKQSILQKAFTGELTADNGETEKGEVAA